MEWIVVLWFYKGMTSFEVVNKEACVQIAEQWRPTLGDARALCVNRKTGETFEVRTW